MPSLSHRCLFLDSAARSPQDPRQHLDCLGNASACISSQPMHRSNTPGATATRPADPFMTTDAAQHARAVHIDDQAGADRGAERCQEMEIRVTPPWRPAVDRRTLGRSEADRSLRRKDGITLSDGESQGERSPSRRSGVDPRRLASTLRDVQVGLIWAPTLRSAGRADACSCR
jgi:hypothetical protein